MRHHTADPVVRAGHIAEHESLNYRKRHLEYPGIRAEIAIHNEALKELTWVPPVAEATELSQDS